MSNHKASERRGRKGSQDNPRSKALESVKIDRLEERIALTTLSPKKGADVPPYPPGTRYSLAKRQNVPRATTGEDHKDRQELRPPEVERLEEKVALSIVAPKKAPEPPPYPPGSLYGLAKRENIVRAASGKEPENRQELPPPDVEVLEEKVALSIVAPKKTPEPPPYPPGTLYGLAKRENIARAASGKEREDRQELPPPEVEVLEEKVALSIVVPKKTPEPPPYPPGTDYSLAKRENLSW